MRARDRSGPAYRFSQFHSSLRGLDMGRSQCEDIGALTLTLTTRDHSGSRSDQSSENAMSSRANGWHFGCNAGNNARTATIAASLRETA